MFAPETNSFDERLTGTLRGAKGTDADVTLATNANNYLPFHRRRLLRESTEGVVVDSNGAHLLSPLASRHPECKLAELDDSLEYIALSSESAYQPTSLHHSVSGSEGAALFFILAWDL